MEEKIETTETPKRRTRRSYTKEFKARLVAQCADSDKSIAQVAMEHQINANLIHKWKRQFDGAETQAMLPVIVGAETPSVSTYIEVTVSHATIRFYGAVHRHSASAIVEALR